MTIRRIKLMADFGCHPIWHVDGSEVGNIDPGELGLSAALVERLATWAEAYEGIMDWGDPGSAGFASPQDEAQFDAEGARLAEQIRAQLGDEWRVDLFVSATSTLEPDPRG
jgi:hypothetical protein